jgi:hypothetical protein
MKHEVSIPPISKDLALKLCAEIREEAQGKRYSYAAWQCWACENFAHGNPDKLNFATSVDFRGCMLINERFARLSAQSV